MADQPSSNLINFAKFATFCRARRGYSEATIDETIRKLRYMQKHDFDLGDFDEEGFYVFIGWKKRDGARNSCLNHYVKAINRWCTFIELPYHFKQYKEFPREPPLLSHEEVHDLIHVYDKRTPIDKRNKLIVLFLAKTGLRNNELCTLKLSSIDWAHSEIMVMGKGGGMQKPRAIPIDRKLLDGKTYPSLKNYIDYWRFPTDKQFLFTTKNGKLTPCVVRGIVKDAANKIDLSWVHPHSLRHYFATSVLLATNNLFLLSKYLGHGNLETTATYLHLIEGDLRRLVNHPNVVDPLYKGCEKTGGAL